MLSREDGEASRNAEASHSEILRFAQDDDEHQDFTHRPVGSS